MSITESHPFGSGHYGTHPPLVRNEPGRGMRVVVQVLVVTGLLCALLVGVGGKLTADHWRGEGGEQQSRGATLLRDTMASVTALPYEMVATMNGSTVFDGVDATDSDFGVVLNVTQSSSDLLKVEAVLRNIRGRENVTQVVTFRGRG